MILRAAVTVLLGLACGTAAGRAAEPTVASLDFCADQYVLALAERERIAAVSPYAETEFSYFADRAAGLPKIRPTAEEVLLLAPDLVVRQWGGDYGAGEVLERFGIPVVQVSFGVTLENARENLLRIGSALGREERAEELAAEMDARLAHINQAAAGARPAALYLTPSGASAGRGTFVHNVLEAAGVHNMAADESHAPWPFVDLEQLALTPPDLIVAGFFDLRSREVTNWSLSRHRFLRQKMEELPVVQVPSRQVACAAWFVVDAVSAIADARLALQSPALMKTGGF